MAAVSLKPVRGNIEFRNAILDGFFRSIKYAV